MAYFWNKFVENYLKDVKSYFSKSYIFLLSIMLKSVVFVVFNIYLILLPIRLILANVIGLFVQSDKIVLCLNLSFLIKEA